MSLTGFFAKDVRIKQWVADLLNGRQELENRDWGNEAKNNIFF